MPLEDLDLVQLRQSAIFWRCISGEMKDSPRPARRETRM
jgi:hypothetical protein